MIGKQSLSAGLVWIAAAVLVTVEADDSSSIETLSESAVEAFYRFPGAPSSSSPSSSSSLLQLVPSSSRILYYSKPPKGKKSYRAPATTSAPEDTSTTSSTEGKAASVHNCIVSKCSMQTNLIFFLEFPN